MSTREHQVSQSIESKKNSLESDVLLERILEQLVQINESIQEMSELLKVSLGQTEVDEESDSDEDDTEQSPGPR